MCDYDLIVVGGGPAGATAARVAAAAGLRVALFERAGGPREKICGGFVSHKALVALGEPLPTDVIERRITTVEVRTGPLDRANRGRASVNACAHARHGTAALGVTVRRAAFDEYLLEQARRAGAVIERPAAVRAIHTAGRAQSPRVTMTTGRTVSAAAVIDATGAVSLFRRRGPLWPLRRRTLGFAYRAIVPAPARHVDTGMSDERLILAEHPVRAGFGWLFPLSGAVNIGVGAWTLTPRGLRSVYRRYVDEAIEDGLIADAARAVAPAAAFLPPGGPPYRLSDGGVLFVGDAAGTVDPYGGEGIYGAIESGRCAARAVASVLRRGGAVAGAERVLEATTRVGEAYRRSMRGQLVRELRFAFLRAGWEAGRAPLSCRRARLRRTARLVSEVMMNPVAYRDRILRWRRLGAP